MRKWRKSAIQTLAAISAFCMLICIQASATQTELKEVRDEIEQLEEEQQENRNELEELQEDKAYLDGKLSDLNSRLSEVSEELSALQLQLVTKEEEIQENQQKLEVAREAEAAQYEDMKTRIQFMYERGSSSVLEMLLGARSFADFLNLSTYVESVHGYDRRMLKEYQSMKEEIAEREIRLEEEQLELEALVLQQEEAKEKVEGLLAEVKENIASTNTQIAEAENNIAENEQQLASQRAYEDELEARKATEDAKRLEEIKNQEKENTAPPVISDSESDLAMLAALIECEAGGESYEGKLAVGSVVMNRVRSSYFPNTVVGVIYQSGQFSPVASGRFAVVLSRGATADCVSAASECLGGRLIINSLYFRRNTGAIQGTVIGNHVFY